NLRGSSKQRDTLCSTRGEEVKHVGGGCNEIVVYPVPFMFGPREIPSGCHNGNTGIAQRLEQAVAGGRVHEDYTVYIEAARLVGFGRQCQQCAEALRHRVLSNRTEHPHEEGKIR